MLSPCLRSTLIICHCFLCHCSPCLHTYMNRFRKTQRVPTELRAPVEVAERRCAESSPQSQAPQRRTQQPLLPFYPGSWPPVRFARPSTCPRVPGQTPRGLLPLPAARCPLPAAWSVQCTRTPKTLPQAPLTTSVFYLLSFHENVSFPAERYFSYPLYHQTVPGTQRTSAVSVTQNF